MLSLEDKVKSFNLDRFVARIFSIATSARHSLISSTISINLEGVHALDFCALHLLLFLLSITLVVLLLRSLGLLPPYTTGASSTEWR